MNYVLSTTLVVMLLVSTASPAPANQINTGSPEGAYYATFCPALETQLAGSKFEYKCVASDGTADNLSRVAADARQIGYGQLDIFALKSPALGGGTAFVRLRTDDVRECVFAVTRNREITSYGDIAVNAGRLRFVLPALASGSTGTFRYLQQIDGDGVGRAKSVLNAKDTAEAIKLALSADDTVAFFVQFPDADNAHFKAIHDQGGHVVPVIDRAILRQQIDGQKVYFAQETEVANAKWLQGGKSVITACTPQILFTGATDRVVGDKARQDHRDMIATVANLTSETLLPKQSVLARWWKRTRELSGQSVDSLVELSQAARDRAKPLLDKAQELGAEAMQKAQEAAERARKAAEGVLEPKPQ